MTPAEALQTATIVPARMVGADKRTGSIAVGKEADLVLVDGDVANDLGALRRVVTVVSDGYVMDGDALAQGGGVQRPAEIGDSTGGRDADLGENGRGGAAPLMLTGCLWGPGKFTSNLALNKAGTFVLDYQGEIMLQMPDDKGTPAEPWSDKMARCYEDGEPEVDGADR